MSFSVTNERPGLTRTVSISLHERGERPKRL